eukprot:TRINITY_DN3537_c0_g1_i1.p1 TRINITY_DN3537_c0_g1~~TRINITY_DN3537_c0_g1_i1.p1  ORF type:complete len:336 (+),score=54.74 TRINITY_DN3537_c0_g1_i1:79-1086(+)
MYRARVKAAAILALWQTVGAEVSQMDKALSDDSECAAGAGASCSFNALQVKGTMVTEQEEETQEQEYEDAEYLVPEDRVMKCCASCSGGFCSPESGSCHRSKSKPYYKDCSSISHEASKGCSIHEERIAELWETCASRANRGCKSCGIFGAMHTRGKHGGGCPGVIYVGEKVVPRKPCSGGEGITVGTAGEFNKVWSCAARKTGASPSMALIMNPWMARTQHHLHIITKPLDSRGAHLAQRLEKVTGCMPGQWHKAHWACHYSWAQLYNHLPPVFTEVYDLASTGQMGALVENPSGERTLATVGISVLHICGGKPVVLATGDGHGGCSVEHAMTR